MMLIQNSDAFRDRFALHVKNTPCAATRAVKDLSMAKQRFDSTSKPIGRFVLWLDAVLCTAVDILKERSGRVEALQAAAFLLLLDEEKVILIALLGDAGDEGVILTRFLDNEEFPTEELADETAHFLARIEWLFVKGGARQLGFTAHALQ